MEGALICLLSLSLFSEAFTNGHNHKQLQSDIFDWKRNYQQKSTDVSRQKSLHDFSPEFCCDVSDWKKMEGNREATGGQNGGHFFFHKVDLESSKDPFTKRPYHNSILAIRANPPSGVLEAVSLPNHYLIFNNKSLRTFDHWQPLASESEGIKRLNSDHKQREQQFEGLRGDWSEASVDSEQLLSSSNQNLSWTLLVERTKEEIGEGDPRKWSPLEMGGRRGFTEEIRQYDSFQEQLRFLRRWLRRLEQHQQHRLEQHKRHRRRHSSDIGKEHRNAL